ncbi:MAG: VCBS repeat-containing protein [Planctomycetes bacterium]|nr:VCBS repeat-containing protein [Planctomycetota bacterium]
MRFGKNAIIVLSIGGGMFLWTAAARTQSTHSALEAPPAFHREQPDDPPGKAAKDNPHARSPAAHTQRGPFVSIQVNVDEFGNNIVGDAANEPSIAIDPNDPDKIAIGWRQFDTVNSNFRQAGWGYSLDAGQTWIFPGVLEPGQFRSDPVLASDADGNFYYSSLSALDSVQVFKSTNGGVTWSTMVDAFGGDKQWIAVDRTSGIGSGQVYQIWNVQFSCCPPNDFTRSTNGGASFESPIQVGPPSMKWGTMDVGPDGTLYLAGATLSQEGHLFTETTNAQDPMQTPIFAPVQSIDLGGETSFSEPPNPAGLQGQVWIATDHSAGQTQGNVYMLGSVDPPSGDPLDVMFIRSTDGGQTWSPPLRINDDPPGTNAWQWFGTMSVAPNGRIDVVWNDTRNSGVANLSELFYSFSTDEGVTWSTNIPVSPQFDSHVGWPNQNKIGDYYDMISDSFGSNVAYAATFNGEQDVYFLRIDLNDCNNNGIDDDQDIAEGTSADCNGNEVPDECEDCNENGQADSCDIDDGTSEDCNGNGVPDECEDFDVGVLFVEQIISTAADRPVSVFAADLDGDGDTDVLSASQIDDKIAWYENTDGLGSFGPQQIISTAADNAFSVFAADLDGDGDNDVLSASFSDDKIAWYENTDGLGSFGPQQIISTAADGARSVFAADLDGDGDSDVLSASVGDGKIAWYENTDGLGSFGPQQIITTTADGASSVFAADLDGDGDIEVLSASWYDDKIAWYQPPIERDCNGNEIPDECDIAEGTSVDCSGNGIPDECEPEVPCLCEGDANGDGVVDPLDSGFVLSRFGCSVDAGDPDCEAADQNGDGLVDPLDVGYVSARFGACR